MYDIFSQLMTILRGMWRFRWYALLATWAVSLLGWTYVMNMENRYESSARVYVDTQGVLKPLLQGLAVESDVESRINMMTRVMLSRPNLEEVIRETDMDIRAETPEQLESMVENLQQRIRIDIPSTKKKDGLYLIRYEDRDPEMAQDVVQTLLNSLVEGTLGSSREDSIGAQRFLRSQISEYESRLTEAEQRLAAFKKDNAGLIPTERGNYYDRMRRSKERLEQVNAEFNQAVNKRNELARLIDQERVGFQRAELEKRIAVKHQELSDLRLTYTSEHPDVQAAREAIRNLKAQLKRVANSTSASVSEESLALNPIYQNLKIALSEMDVQVASLRAQLDGTQQEIVRLDGLVDTIPEVEADLVKLNRDYNVTQEQYEALLARLESAKISENAEESNDDIKFRVIDPPNRPLLPSSPDRPLYISIILFAGIGIGLGLAFLLNELKPVIASVEDLSKFSGLPVLGAVSIKLNNEQQVTLRNNLIALGLLFGLLLFIYAIAMYLAFTA